MILFKSKENSKIKKEANKKIGIRIINITINKIKSVIKKRIRHIIIMSIKKLILSLVIKQRINIKNFKMMVALINKMNKGKITNRINSKIIKMR